MFKSPKYNQIPQSHLYTIICDTAAQEREIKEEDLQHKKQVKVEVCVLFIEVHTVRSELMINLKKDFHLNG